MLLPALLLAAAQIQPAGSSGLLTAGDLKDRCDSAAAGDVSYCYAYVAGVYDTVRAYETWLNVREFCVPAGVSQGELRRTFLDYIAAKPGFRSGEAASVVVVSLKERYACPATAALAPGAKP